MILIYSNLGEEIIQLLAMYNLLYTSNATIETNYDVLNQILSTARGNNEKLGITGMLLYSEGSFVQLLEGDKEKVQVTFKKICSDSRHENIEVVIEANATKRFFPQWQMGFKWLEKSDLLLIENHGNPDIKNYFKKSHPYKLLKLMSINYWQQ